MMDVGKLCYTYTRAKRQNGLFPLEALNSLCFEQKRLSSLWKRLIMLPNWLNKSLDM